MSVPGALDDTLIEPLALEACGSALREDPGRRRPRRDLRARAHTQLTANVLEMSVHGALGDDELLRDLTTRQALRDERHDLALACSQRGHIRTDCDFDCVGLGRGGCTTYHSLRTH